MDFTEKPIEYKPTKEELVKYKEYYTLSIYARNCLSATNYWSIINGQAIIDVPAHDENYYKHFDKRCYAIRERNTKRAELMKSMNIPMPNQYPLDISLKMPEKKKKK
jgi:hypothetical protein